MGRNLSEGQGRRARGRSAAPRNRAAAIQRVKDQLLRESFPRLQMALLVALTGGFGLISSFTLLRLGLDSMALRYPVALVFAYLFFLFLIWLWLRTNAKDHLDAPDLTGWVPRPRGSDSHEILTSGGGGDFAGGGASATLDGAAAPDGDAASLTMRAVGEAVGPAADADELAIPLLVIALAIGMALASLYVIYIAPVLLAEVLVDGVLAAVLFRHLRGQQPQHWIASTVRRTAWPFAITAVFLTGMGAAMEAAVPGANSVGQVVLRANAGRVAH